MTPQQQEQVLGVADQKYIAQLLKDQPSEEVSAFLHLDNPSYNAISIVRNLQPEMQE